MKINIFKYLFSAIIFIGIGNIAEAQKGKKKNSQKRTTASQTKAKVQKSTPTEDTVAKEKPKTIEAEEKTVDTLPVPKIRPSLRPDEAVETQKLTERAPLVYEHLRADDAVYRHRIWREIDIREKMNQTFSYTADADNGNQRFIYILFKAIEDSTNPITAFDAVDDRFTTPISKSELIKKIVGEPIEVPIRDSIDPSKIIGKKFVTKEINPDSSFYRFQIKEEVIFDKESSRLFWRILGIAPVIDYKTSEGVFVGSSPLFWLYYPDLRSVLAKYEVYNGKNFGGRMSWEELFESRMFSGRIIKSSMDNPKNLEIKNMPGLIDKPLHQLFEGETIKEKIFTYEQDQWSY
jgi:gliding motility associated protien GldN